MTIERGMWQAFGLRLDEMDYEDYALKSAMLAAEADHEKKKGERK